MEKDWIAYEVFKILDETSNTKRFFFKIPEGIDFDFSPGQFVTLDLPIHESPKKRLRSYSIASPPDTKDHFELLIVLNPEGAGTPYLFNEVKVGSKVLASKPLGKFILPKTLEKEICFVCTGTGIAPFRSMIQHIYINNLSDIKITLIFGTRFQKDLLYVNEMLDYAKVNSNFTFIPILSRENGTEWSGERGYVHSVYERIYQTKQPASFYLCGWKDMLLEARKRLQEIGYTRDDIHLELYG